MQIETLCVTQCTRALINFLQSTDGTHTSAEDCYLVFKILTEWSIPAAHALVSAGSSDCKVMSARLALSILSFSRQETGEAIGTVIEKWYRDSGQWKAAFEAAIQIVVSTVISMLLKLHCVSTGKRKQVGDGSHRPTSVDGFTTRRFLLSGCCAVSSGVE
jgi:hypothetical protein